MAVEKDARTGPGERARAVPRAARPLSPADVLGLQEAAGNGAVAGLLRAVTVQRDCGVFTARNGSAMWHQAVDRNRNNRRAFREALRSNWDGLYRGCLENPRIPARPGMVAAQPGARPQAVSVRLSPPAGHAGPYDGKTKDNEHGEIVAIRAAWADGVTDLWRWSMWSESPCCYLCSVICAVLGITVNHKDATLHEKYPVPPEFFNEAKAEIRRRFWGQDCLDMLAHLAPGQRGQLKRTNLASFVLYNNDNIL